MKLIVFKKVNIYLHFTVKRRRNWTNLIWKEIFVLEIMKNYLLLCVILASVCVLYVFGHPIPDVKTGILKVSFVPDEELDDYTQKVSLSDFTDKRDLRNNQEPAFHANCLIIDKNYKDGINRNFIGEFQGMDEDFYRRLSSDNMIYGSKFVNEGQRNGLGSNKLMPGSDFIYQKQAKERLPIFSVLNEAKYFDLLPEKNAGNQIDNNSPVSPDQQRMSQPTDDNFPVSQDQQRMSQPTDNNSPTFPDKQRFDQQTYEQSKFSQQTNNRIPVDQQKQLSKTWSSSRFHQPPDNISPVSPDQQRFNQQAYEQSKFSQQTNNRIPVDQQKQLSKTWSSFKFNQPTDNNPLSPSRHWVNQPTNNYPISPDRHRLSQSTDNNSPVSPDQQRFNQQTYEQSKFSQQTNDRIPVDQQKQFSKTWSLSKFKPQTEDKFEIDQQRFDELVDGTIRKEGSLPYEHQSQLKIVESVTELTQGGKDKQKTYPSYTRRGVTSKSFKQSTKHVNYFSNLQSYGPDFSNMKLTLRNILKDLGITCDRNTKLTGIGNVSLHIHLPYPQCQISQDFKRNARAIIGGNLYLMYRTVSTQLRDHRLSKRFFPEEYEVAHIMQCLEILLLNNSVPVPLILYDDISITSNKLIQKEWKNDENMMIDISKNGHSVSESIMLSRSRKPTEKLAEKSVGVDEMQIDSILEALGNMIQNSTFAKRNEMLLTDDRAWAQVYNGSGHSHWGH